MTSELLSAVTGILSQLPTNSVLRERVEFLKDRIEALEKRLQDLEQENTNLRSRLAVFEDSEVEKALSPDFVEHRGALFKRKPGGGYEPTVYCPDCQRSTSSLMGQLPYHCARCKWSADFNGMELDKVLKELPNP